MGAARPEPRRRILEFCANELGARYAVLSCGHTVFGKVLDGKKLGARMGCSKCAEQGNHEKMPEDEVSPAGEKRLCVCCGCRLRSSQTNAVCDPCNRRGGR